MRGNLFISSVAVFVLFSVSCVVLVEADSSTGWSQTYGGTEYERLSSMILTSDGGYVIAGSTGSFGDGDYNIWLVKIDEFGKVEWNQTYGSYGEHSAHTVIETSDGGFAIAGGISYNYFWLIKTDSSGNMEWSSYYDSFGSFHSVVETSDGGYMLAGNYVDWWIYSDFLLIKTDESGNVEWNQTYDGGQESVFANSFVATSDGGFAIAGSNVLVKFSSLGDKEWSINYGDGHCYSLVETSDGGYVLTGTIDSLDNGDLDFWLIKTNASGTIEWKQTYGGTGTDFAYSVVEAVDGGYALAGKTNSSGAGDYDFWLVKTDENGTMEWNKTFGGTKSDEAHSLVKTSDGGYAIAGTTYSFGAGSQDFWVIKTDEYGFVSEVKPPDIYSPLIDFCSPPYGTYNTSSVSLNFTVHEETSWMGYSLDEQDNVTLTENTLNLTGLTNGVHNLTVYATDTSGNTGASKRFIFTVAKEPEPPPITWHTVQVVMVIVAEVIVIAAVVGYITKTQKNQKPPTAKLTPLN